MCVTQLWCRYSFPFGALTSDCQLSCASDNPSYPTVLESGSPKSASLGLRQGDVGRASSFWSPEVRDHCLAFFSFYWPPHSWPWGPASIFPGVSLQSLLGLHISSVLRYHSASHSVGTLVITLRTHPDAPG